MNKFTFLAAKIFLVFLLLTQPVYAERVNNLYTLSSLVDDTSDEQRSIAANQLLRKLLVRVSGTRKVLGKLPPNNFSADPKAYAKHPNFQVWSDFSSAQSFINQYSYTSMRKGNQRLEVIFDEVGVKQLLHRLGAPVWDANRPKVLFWIALENDKGRSLVTPRTHSFLSNVLAEQNAERGIPYQLPVKTIPRNMFSNIWNDHNDQVIAASDTYQPDAIAIGKIKLRGKKWQVEWQLFTGKSTVKHTSSATTLRRALQEGVSFTAEELSKRYASQTGQGAGTYKVMVTNVRHLQDYATLNNYLNGLSLTSKVRVVQSMDQSVLFEVSLRGGLDQLRANLTLDGRLKEESFIGLQKTAASPKQLEADQEEVVPEQADAYFHWQAN